MPDLDELNPHLALALSESYVSPGERRWDAWTKKVEQLLGHDLDGNQDRDGYSLDAASDHFDAGDTPEQYVEQVRADKAKLVADLDDDPNDHCSDPNGHEWTYTGTAYGGDDESYFGEGRCYCVHCGADGDA